MGLRAFTFDGTSSSDFGMFITEASPYNAPERAVEMIEIPGRNGAYALDKGNFENVEQTYHVVVHGSNDADFREMMSDVRNWLCSKIGYCRLSDDYNPGEYRMATYKSGLETDSTFWNGTEFDVTFDCKPQRYLLEGEEKIVIGEYKELAGTDNEPYLFRQSPQFSAEYDTGMDELVGGTVAWNQMVNQTSHTKTENGITWVRNTDGTITATGTATANTSESAAAQTISVIKGHKYLFMGCPTGGSRNTYFIMMSAAGVTGNTYETGNGNIFNGLSDGVTNCACMVMSGETVNITFKAQVFDLTQMFGSTIADYIYSLEQANAGAGVAWFRKLFPKPYYAYNAGELMSVQASSHDMVGFNAWDEETELGGIGSSNGVPYSSSSSLRSKNFCGCVGGQTYYFKGTFACYWYDENQGFIKTDYVGNNTRVAPTNARYFKIALYEAYGTTYKNDICINLSWDGERDGEYEEYVKHSYPLDSDLTLRGIPKLDASNNLYYDGDVYESDGTVTRKYGIVTIDGSTAVASSYNNSGNTAIVVQYTASEIKQPSDGLTMPLWLINSYGLEIETPNRQYANNIDCISVPHNTANRITLTFKDITTLEAVRQKLTAKPITIVYELATPTTETADAFEEIQTCYADGTEEYVVPEQSGVALPVGHNTKYGKNPIVLINPTWFPSKPLLAVDGYGEIKFNNRSIVNIENATLGDIKQLVNESKTLSMTTTFDNAMFNVGDTITVDLSYFNYGAYIIMNASTTPTTSGTVTDSDAHFTTVVTDCVADQGISPSPLYVHVKTTCTPITFTLGTPDTVTNTTEAVVDTQGDKCKWTQTVKYEIDGSGNHKISIKQTLVGASGTNVTTATNMNSNPMILCNSVVAHSTLSILGNPTYIDCDIGEAYMVKDGEPISLNQYIDLGSDLPTLPPGDTEVTYDNTITKVEVKPNWWKV